MTAEEAKTVLDYTAKCAGFSSWEIANVYVNGQPEPIGVALKFTAPNLKDKAFAYNPIVVGDRILNNCPTGPSVWRAQADEQAILDEIAYCILGGGWIAISQSPHYVKMLVPKHKTSLEELLIEAGVN